MSENGSEPPFEPDNLGPPSRQLLGAKGETILLGEEHAGTLTAFVLLFVARWSFSAVNIFIEKFCTASLMRNISPSLPCTSPPQANQ